MKQTLQLKLAQHLTLTPQLQQSIRLLQLSTLELNQELEKFLNENPLLERADIPEDLPPIPTSVLARTDEAFSREQQLQADRTPELGGDGNPESGFDHPSEGDGPLQDDNWGMEASYGSRNNRDDDDDGDRGEIPRAAEAISLRDHLLGQIALTALERRDMALVGVLIEDLDENGYLTQTLEEIAEILPEELEIDPDELLVALKHLQQLDPVGVGARSAAECLCLQLHRKEADTPGRTLALAIVGQHIELLAARDFVRLKKLLQCNDDELRVAHHLIKSLDPRPGAAYAPLEARYVVADVIVKKSKGQWVVTLNREAMPKLRVNRMYAGILQGTRGAGPLSQQLQEARWMIKNVQQRFDTILRVSQAIVERQKQFFEHGEVAMRPLVLREIADILDLHESTVSRVTTQKFMLTPRGIFELKYFFGSHVATDEGGECSATAIRALIKQLVTAEDDKRPLSDSRIAEILGEQGIVVARRTIAKYRESLQIPPVNMRKAI
jgi:RNA polymerase sigma-54 factor